MSYEIIVTLTFEKEIKQLRKKYKKIKDDYLNLIQKLKNRPTSGIPLGKNCYKIRVANSSIPTGKSRGFRIITLVKIEGKRVFLLSIYSKSDKENISDDELQQFIDQIS